MRLEELVKLLPEGKEVCIYDWYYESPRALIITPHEIRIETPWGTERFPLDKIGEVLKKFGFQEREEEIYVLALFKILESKQIFHRIYSAKVSVDKETTTHGLISDGVVYADSFLIDLALRILDNRSTLAEFY